MKINFMEPNRAYPGGLLQIDDARIIWPNFSGRGGQYNREGDRDFHLVIPDQDTADKLLADTNKFGDSWNVKIKPPRDEDSDPLIHMKVKVKFNNCGPNIQLVCGGKQRPLTEETVGMLDDIIIDSVDLDIRPYDGEMRSGSTFRTAYLNGMRVYMREDRFSTPIDDMDI